jgi:hypothetical protein
MAAAGPVMGRYKPILIAAVAGNAEISRRPAIRKNRLMSALL